MLIESRRLRQGSLSVGTKAVGLEDIIRLNTRGGWPDQIGLDASCGEIDLLIQKRGSLSLIECKAGADASKEDAGAMGRFAPKDDIIESECVVCLSPKPYMTKDGTPVIPASSI